MAIKVGVDSPSQISGIPTVVNESIDSVTGKPVPNESVNGAASVTEAANRQKNSVLISDYDVNLVLKPVASFLVHRKEILSLQMEVRVNALAAFEVRYKYSKDGEYITRANTDLDFTTPNAPILGASGTWVTAAVSNSHWIKLDVSGIYAVQLWASSSLAAGTETIINGSVK